MSKAKEVLSTIDEGRGSSSNEVSKLAVKMVGDGKKPNKYFVTVGNHYEVIQGSETLGVDEVIKKFKNKSKTINVYDSYAEAKAEADSFYLGERSHGIRVRSVTIEDRLSGVVYEKVKELNLDTLETFEREHDDIGYTKKELGKDFK